MRRLVSKLAFGAVFGSLVIGTGAHAEENGEARRIVAIGGSVTEIVYALGEQDRLIARDQTSTYPPEAEELPHVGYIRRLSPEGLLSANPDLVIAMEGYGPPEAKSVIEAAGIPIAEIPEGYDGAAIVEKIRATAVALGTPDKGEALAAEIKADLEAAEKAAKAAGGPARILFVLALQDGRIMAAGSDSHADGIIHMAGAENALKGFSGYKQVTDEAIITAQPDVVLMMDRGGDHDSTEEALFDLPSIQATPAGRNRRLIRMDGLYLLGFGPRTANAIRDLNEQIAGLDPTVGSN
ncbi:heme/hemin ABC transporter substrate-binding protein [Hoeflea sp.]|uniref:heme/hemin ABC transporter substrate-binding protein n=1 Tax=Hoeflea sp. TaxID=1940281 RepID=UPI003B52ACD3